MKYILYIYLFVSFNTHACCGNREFKLDEFLSYDAIFTGKILEIDKSENPKWKFKISVSEVYRGKVDDTIIVTTSWITTTGANFKINEEWLVSGRLYGNFISTDLCYRNMISTGSQYNSTVNKIIEFKKITDEVFIEYDHNNEIIYTGYVKDGNKDGAWIYYKNGIASDSTFYVDGKRDNNWKFYNNDKLSRVEEYKLGVMISREEFDYENNLIRRYDYIKKEDSFFDLKRNPIKVYH